MPFSCSSRFAQSLSFIRALLPHTLCARTCVYTHTHTHTHTIVLGIGVYTCHLSHGKLRRKPQHPTLGGFLAVSHPCNSCSWFLYKSGDQVAWGFRRPQMDHCGYPIQLDCFLIKFEGVILPALALHHLTGILIIYFQKFMFW